MRSHSLVLALGAAIVAAGCATPQTETAQAAPNPRVKFGKPISNADIAPRP